jgi:hypothetical protein
MVLHKHRATPGRRCIPQIHRGGFKARQDVLQTQDTNEYVCVPMEACMLNCTVPYSGGSSLEANFSAPFGGMSVDFSHMDQIVTLHAEE